MTGLGNLPVVLDINNKLNPTFISLQETWLRTYKNASFAELLRSHHWIIKNADCQLNEEDMITMRNLSFHGVALGVSEELAEKIEEISVQYRNIIAIKIKLENEELLVINIYLPTRGKDVEFDEAIDAVKAVIEENATGEQKIILMGDTNVDETSSPRRRNRWKSLLEEYDLHDNITGNPTHFHHTTGAAGELDRFVTRGLTPHIESIKDELGTSDHVPVLATIEIKKQKKHDVVKGDPIETNVNIQKLLENLELFKELTNKLADEIESWREDYDLDTQNGLISSMIFQTAISVTKQKMYQSQVDRKRKRYKIDRELRKGLRVAKMNYKRQGNKSKKSPAFERVKHYKRLIKQQLEEQKAKEQLKINNDIINATRQRSSKIFSMLKKIKQQTLSENKLPSWIEGYGLKFEAPKVLEGLRELFRQQTTIDYAERYNEERFEAAKDVVRRMREHTWPEEEYKTITMSENEFQKIIDKLKSGKAQDFTGMSNDLLKNVGERMKELIYKITIESLEKRDIGGIIRNFGKGTIIIKKPGKPTTIIKNWRKIVCNNTILNVLQLHVQPRIEEKAKEVQTKFQLGFTKGIPIANAVIAREELQQISKHMNRTFFLGVLDLQSCFPRICREEMLVLASEILPKEEWDILSQIYDNTWGELRVEAQKSKPIIGDSGSIEGGLLSVQILKIYIAVLLRTLENAGFTAGVHYTLRELKPGQIGVADDLLLYSWSAWQLRKMLKICQDWSDNYRATFSSDKSVVVIQRARGDNGDHGDFMMNGEKLKVVKSAEHLGIPIDERGDNTNMLVEERIGKTRRAIHGTIALFDNRSFVTAAVKLQVWKTQYRFILIYGLDLTNLKAGQLRKIEQFQVKILRAIFGLSKRASAVKLRLITGTTTMAMEIWKSRFGALNNVLVGNTMVRDLCMLAYYCEVKQSWTVKTIKKMFEILDEERASHLVNAEDFLGTERKVFKENIRNLMFGIERRKMEQEIKDSDIYTLLPEPFKSGMPMINTGFNYKMQRDLKRYVAIFTGDYYRFFKGPCPICVRKGKMDPDSTEKDDTRHLLSGRCVVDEDPNIAATWADILLTVSVIKQDHPLVTQVNSSTEVTKFLLNPTNVSLGEMTVTPEDLQLSGLDNLIRKFLGEKHIKRYQLLRKFGIVNTKRKA